MEFSRQEYWSELPFPSPGDLPTPGIEPRSPASQADSQLSELPGKPCFVNSHLFLFDCAGSLLLLWTFSSCRERGSLPSCGAGASHCSGFSCQGAWALQPVGFSSYGTRFSCSIACRVILDQGSNLCPLHWQADS